MSMQIVSGCLALARSTGFAAGAVVFAEEVLLALGVISNELYSATAASGEKFYATGLPSGWPGNAQDADRLNL